MNEDQSGGETRFIGHYPVERPVQGHADGFSRALQDALQQAQERGVIEVGGKYESEVHFSIDIEVTNPPWVGDYKVSIEPKPRP
jgi:hypothetical protein